MANLDQSTTASENLEDVSGEAPTITAPEYKMPQAADLAVLSNASEKGPMKITCFSFLLWNAHTGNFRFL